MRSESNGHARGWRARTGLPVLLLGLGIASSASAAGIEDTVGGAIGLGRAAYYARVNDFMAVLQNPANLAVVPKGELGLELRLPMLSACYDRARDLRLEYKTVDGELVESFGRTCNDAGPGLTANLGWAKSFDSGWGYGIGLFTPAAAGSSKYGSAVNRTLYPNEGEPYPMTTTGVESPTRQMAIEREGVVAYLMAGLGAQPIKQLRFGVSAGIGFASVYNKSVVSLEGGTFNDQEVINELRANDYAIPRVTGSVVLSPLDSLDLVTVMQYQGDIEAEGKADLTANGINAPRRSCFQPNPGSHCRIEGVKLHVPLHTLEMTFGVRYAKRRIARERVLDPMKDEVFDVEVDVAWAQTSHVDNFTVNLHDRTPGTPGFPTIQFANGDGLPASPIRKQTAIPKNWNDTWTVRVGGDWNLIRERLALRAGASYATRAVPLEYMNIDYMPVQKLGLHLGATMAFGSYRLTAAYAHLFYQELVVGVGDGMVKEIATLKEDEATAVNEGTFTGALNVLSLQVSAQFK